MGIRARAILWAQWRSLRNYLPRSSRFGLVVSILFGITWYGGFVTLAVSAGLLMSDPGELATIAKVLPGALLLCFLYWQAVPLMLASTGWALDTRKLLAYPIAARELFWLEVLLRASTGVEVLLALTGAGIGLLFNPRIPFWAPLALALFGLFNLLISAGVRDLLLRLFARKGVRELLVFLFVIAAALPQLLLMTGPIRGFLWIPQVTSWLAWPWIAAAGVAQGRLTWRNASVLLGWTLVAYAFGRSQFERGLRFDAQEQSATRPANPAWAALLDRVYRLPGALWPDPLGALIEKELRFLSRSARVRLVFLMGFSFGLLIWLPATFGRLGWGNSWTTRNYLALVSLYALTLLGDALLWNVFGFDRSAAQFYFVAPLKFETVLLAKNLSAALLIAVEVTLIAAVCALLRFPVSPIKLVEAYVVTLLAALFLMAAGNLSSTYHPTPVDPSKSFHNRQMQVALLGIYPFALIPVALAYAARYAFASQLAFAGVLAFDAALGVIVYRIATESAVAAAVRRKEAILEALSHTEGPVSS